MRMCKPAGVALLLLSFAIPASAWTIKCGELTVDEKQRIIITDAHEMQPGQTIKPGLGVTGLRKYPGWPYVAVDCKATWTIKPQAGVQLNRSTGELHLDAAVPAGRVYTLTANVPDVSKPVVAELRVFTAKSAPLVGTWRERGGQDIEELEFKANGNFAVARHPFESYHDYWGTYTFDLATGALELKVKGSSYLPKDLVPKGHFRIEGNTLILKGIYLGTWKTKTPAGHIFTK